MENAHREPVPEPSVLEEAMKAIGARAKTHGEDTSACFQAIAALWESYLYSRKREPGGGWPALTGFDVAQMMVLFKVARSIAGDANHMDHYVDQAGYSALAFKLAKANESA